MSLLPNCSHATASADPPHRRTTGEFAACAEFAYGTGRLANIFGSLIVAAIFGGFGYQPVFVYIAACGIVVATTVAIFGPRTGMLHLENISAAGLDDQSPHVRKLGVG